MSDQLLRSMRIPRLSGALTLMVFLVAGINFAHAQSTTRSRGATTRSAPHGSSTKPQSASGRLALEGYCPVCVINSHKWVKGNPSIQATYDGKIYYFPAIEQKEMFMADPAKYVPALGGDCTVCLAQMGKRIPGTIHHAALRQNRLFLFPGKQQKQEFLANPDKYIDTDLALDGNCVVCRVELKKDVPGNPEIAEYYQGFRYLFPSDKQREMFRANPAKYAVKRTATPRSKTSGSTTRPSRT